MSRSNQRQYKILEKSNDYDHQQAEEYAEVVMELRELKQRESYLKELIDDHSDLKEYVWTTKEGVTIPLHKIEDDHLGNIMTWLIEQNRRIPAQIKAEARSRTLDIPDDSLVRPTPSNILSGKALGSIGSLNRINVRGYYE